MRTLGIGTVMGFALVALACAGSTRSGKAATGASGGSAATSAGDTAGGSAARPASASSDATSAGGERKVEGRIELIDRANEVMLSGTETVGHAFDKLKLDEGTEVIVNGERGTIADVNEGQEVRASFSQRGDVLHLDRVEIVSPND